MSFFTRGRGQFYHREVETLNQSLHQHAKEIALVTSQRDQLEAQLSEVSAARVVAAELAAVVTAERDSLKSQLSEASAARVVAAELAAVVTAERDSLKSQLSEAFAAQVVAASESANLEFSVSKLSLQNTDLQRQLFFAHEQIRLFTSSTSWWLTTPLRWIKKQIGW